MNGGLFLCDPGQPAIHHHPSIIPPLPAPYLNLLLYNPPTSHHSLSLRQSSTASMTFIPLLQVGSTYIHIKLHSRLFSSPIADWLAERNAYHSKSASPYFIFFYFAVINVNMQHGLLQQIIPPSVLQTPPGVLDTVSCTPLKAAMSQDSPVMICIDYTLYA